MTPTLPPPMVPAEVDLRARFNRVRAHYRKHEAAITASRDEWAIDPYAWDHEAGIVLTPIERALWHDIRAEDLVLYPQHPVGRFFVDFGNPAWKVAIECDGARWHVDAQRDADRQAQIEAMGWSVYRISGRDCFTDQEISEDEHGRTRVRAGAARVFIRDIAARHPYLKRARAS
jgi:hypothetical protein